MARKTRLSRFFACLRYAGYVGTAAYGVSILSPVPLDFGSQAASTSIVVLPLMSVMVLLVYTRTTPSRTEQVIFYGTMAVALVGLVAPNAALYRVAASTESQLSISLDYMTFDSQTTIEPTAVMPYKSVNGSSLYLAHYRSGGVSDRPVVILLHAGGWQYGSFLETGDWPRTLTNAGYDVISVQYRLANSTYHTWQDAPRDVSDAVAYVRTNASLLGVDPNKLSLMGQSAGGHLALLHAYREGGVRSVVSLYAPADPALDYLSSWDKTAELAFIGGPPDELPERYRLVTPENYLSNASARTLLVHGRGDTLVADQNSRNLYAQLRQTSSEHRLLLLPFTGHSFENQRGGFATQIAEQAVVMFLND